MSYATLDYLPDLTPSERSQAGTLIFSPYTPTTPGVTWNESATAYGTEDYAILHSLYKFTANEGESYDIASFSYFDPFVVLVYDAAGNAIAANNENDDPPDTLLADGGYYSSDAIFDWHAPYTGTFYVDASWHQGSYFTFYDVALYGDTRTASTDPSTPPATTGLTINGTAAGESLAGSSGADVINALGGNDSIEGGAGNDTLNGGDGNDAITTGSGHSAVNGNKGDDVIVGRSAVGDWLLGGQGNDLVGAIGSTGGHNILNGNIGNDTVFGGDHGDTLRGGQGDDQIYGGRGDDLIYADLGRNTITAGAGADTFHNGAGVAQDIITDFHQAEGDRVQIDASLTYRVSQVGADVRIDVSNGDSIVLQNTQQTSLSGSWLVQA
jgi:Ca2+-binding RTX toxin-like protein